MPQINPFLSYETGFDDKHLVMTSEQFQWMENFLDCSPAQVVDFETSGLKWFQHAEACGIGLAGWDGDNLQNFYVPFRHRTGEVQLDFAITGPALKKRLANPQTLKIAHNIKFEDHFARKEGWTLAGPRYDTMIAARLYDENRRMGLEQRAREDLCRTDADVYKLKMTEEVRRLARLARTPISAYRDSKGYSEVNIPLCGTYCCFDTEFSGRLYQLYERVGISKLYSRIWSTEMELTGVLCDMEEAGMPVDVDYLAALRDALGGVMEGLEQSIKHQLGGRIFRLSSDEEMRSFLIDTLGVKLWKLTKGKKLSVDKEALAEHIPAHPVLQNISDWREAYKLHNTYTTSILERLDADNVLHPDYQQLGTNTGRLSCKQPNFQNQPSDSDKRAQLYSGKKLEDGGVDPWSIRRAFCNRGKEWVRLFFDYSQIELRVLAYYTQDPVMMDAYLKGEDIHTRTSLEVFGTKEKAKRRMAKVINFGLSYCMTERGLARQVRIPVEDATKYLNKFFERYSGVASFRPRFWDEVKANGGFFQNIFGRPRRVPSIASVDEYTRTKAERRAIATLIQGTAAELTKESLVRVSKFLKETGLPAQLIATVHDEIQLDCAVDAMVEVSRGVKAQMEHFPEFTPIPIIVDGEWSTSNWAEKHTLPLAA